MQSPGPELAIAPASGSSLRLDGELSRARARAPRRASRPLPVVRRVRRRPARSRPAAHAPSSSRSCCRAPSRRLPAPVAGAWRRARCRDRPAGGRSASRPRSAESPIAPSGRSDLIARPRSASMREAGPAAEAVVFLSRASGGGPQLARTHAPFSSLLSVMPSLSARTAEASITPPGWRRSSRTRHGCPKARRASASVDSGRSQAPPLGARRRSTSCSHRRQMPDQTDLPQRRQGDRDQGRRHRRGLRRAPARDLHRPAHRSPPENGERAS